MSTFHHKSGMTPAAPTQHHAAAPSSSLSPSINPTTPNNTSVFAPRSSSLPFAHHMGSSSSKPTPPLPPSSPASTSAAAVKGGISAAVAGGIKLKRAFAARRKKSEDASSLFAKAVVEQDSQFQQQRSVSQQPQQKQRVVPSPLLSSSTSAAPSMQTFSGKKVATSSPASAAPSMQTFSGTTSPVLSPTPPTPPPKQDPQPVHTEQRLGVEAINLSAAGNRTSVIPISPGISSAVNYMLQEQALSLQAMEAKEIAKPDQGTPTEQEKSKAGNGGDKREWRKSDSTNSHHTIRPSGAGNSSKTSRPVSWAESFQSTHTVVQVSNKRLSALITDADFGMPEEDDESFVSVDEFSSAPPIPAPAPLPSLPAAHARYSPPSTSRPPPSSSASPESKAKNRRSMSLTLGIPSTGPKTIVPAHPPSASAAELRHPSLSFPPPLHSSHNPLAASLPPPGSSGAAGTAYTRVAGFVGVGASSSASLGHPLPPQQQQQQPPLTTSNLNFRERLAAWTAASTDHSLISSPSPSLSPSPNNTNNNNMPRQERNLPALPPSYPSQHLQPHRTVTSPHTPSSIHTPSPTPTTSTAPSSAPSPGFRQTTISMTASGLGPAAAGLAKRAVEKMGMGMAMGKKWGMGMTASHSSSGGGGTGGGGGGSGTGSGYSSSSSNAGSSSFGSTGAADYGLARTSSNQSAQPFSQYSPSRHPHPYHAHKRTPDALSGAHSIASSTTSASDASDPFFSANPGPVLGVQLRGALRSKNGVRVNGAGGVVFGRELRVVVRETAIGVGGGGYGVAGTGKEGMELGEKEGLVRELEGRVVPALVVRCAQHLLVWGVQEEGLFRVSGRPSHVSKLRSEFDSGADYDMTGCTPGDLDPHAVASVFKAYLRELPESILTQKLAHYFDAAISKETTLNAPPQGATPNPHRMSIAPPGMGLPSGPKSNFPPTPTTPSHQNPTPNMRKAPSLSTLAMPSFTGIPPPSAPLLATITALIAQLPKENRDLLRTVVQLINATAKESRETKMPLSNLMVVFSPSLNMSPPLLKVLCEGEGIWGGEGEVIDIRRESVLDIKRMDGVEGGVDVPPPTPTKDAEEETEEDEEEEDEESDEEEDEEEEDQSLLSSGRASLDTSDNPSSDYHASAEEDSSMSMSMSLFDREGLDQRRGDGVRRRWVQEDRERPEVPTVYLDSQSHISSSSTSSLREQDLEPEREQAPAKLNYLHHHRRRDDGSISSGGEYSLNNPPPSSPSPCLSSSAESVATPTSDGNPSFAHLPLVGGDGDGKKETEKEHACQKPQIAETSPLELKKRPVVIGNPMPVVGPVQFPVAQQQQAQAQASKRRSIPILALPTFSSNATDVVPKEKEDSPVASPRSISGGGGLNFRSKKPSLRLLFSKKSASSLNSIGGSAVEKGGKPFISPPMAQYSPSGGGVYLQTPGSASDSSVSTPLSAVTAPQGTSTNASSRSHLPPVLDTPIDDGSLGLGLGLAFDASPPGTAVPVMEEKPTPTPKMSISTTDTIASWYQTMTPSSPTSRSFSSPSSCSYPSPSPVSSSAGVASASVTASQSLRSPIKPGENHLRPQMSTSNLSIASTKSENHLSMFDDGDDEEVEDWTQSVLLAADVDGKWAVQSGGRS